MSCVNPTTNGPSGCPLQSIYDPILRLAQGQPPRNPTRPLTSFFIADILSGRGSEPVRTRKNYCCRVEAKRGAGAPTGTQNGAPTGAIRRPWDDSSSNRSGGYSTDIDDYDDDDDDDEVDGGNEEISVDDDRVSTTMITTTTTNATTTVCPLDALLKMTSKTFDAADRNSRDNDSEQHDSSSLGFSSKSQAAKKRRKSRTAFTNKQIYELEKRFLYQKYLTPVDRDEIAQSLGLTNAQVITWFQNRRAKLKRDMEELKADVTAAKTLGTDPVITGSDELLRSSKASVARRKETTSLPADMSSSLSPTSSSSFGGAAVVMATSSAREASVGSGSRSRSGSGSSRGSEAFDHSNDDIEAPDEFKDGD